MLLLHLRISTRQPSPHIDGDAVYLEGTLLGSRQLLSTRLIGIDTPETVDPRKPVQYFGKEASIFTEKILSKQNVYVTYDQNTKDKYNRLLAYVWLKINNNFYMFNAILVLNGYAHNYPYFPFNEKYCQLRLEMLKNYVRKCE